VTEGVASGSEALAAGTRDLLANAGIRGSRVVTALGGEAVTIREMKLPEMPEAELAHAVVYEAERHLPSGGRDVVRDFQVLGQAPETGQLEILLVAARKEFVDRQLAALRASGLSAVTLDVAPFSMLRAIAGNGPATDPVLYLDLGAESSDILIIEGGRLRLARNITIGGNALTKAIAEGLDLEFADAEMLKEQRGKLFPEGQNLADATSAHVYDAILPVINDVLTEVCRSLDYHQTRLRDRPVTRVVLSGGTAKLVGLAPFMSEELGLPVEIADPFAAFEAGDAFPSEFLHEVGPMMAVAVGLALKGRKAR
jgi:type IV pilus assembly protein PilM